MKNIKIRGSQYFYEECGHQNKEVILMIHGHPFDHSMWKYQYETLRKYHVLIPDLRGYGLSDYDFKKIFIEEQALDLRLMLDELKIENVHLIGLSMGGQIIIEFLRLFPKKVNSLIICASSPVAENDQSYKHRLKLAESINKIGMKEYSNEEIHKYLHPSTIDTKNEVYNHLLTMMQNTSVEGAVASHRGRAERRNNFPYLREIKVPSLVIAGEQDFFFPVEEIKDVSNHIEGSEFEIIPNTGHLPNMENSKAFNKIIADFYSKIIDS